MSEPSLPPHAVLGQMAHGYTLTAALVTVCQLRIADLLQDGPKPIEELARLAEAHPLSLHRVLRGLASAGIFSEESPGHFRHTPTSEALRSDVPGSMRDAVLMVAHPKFWESVGQLTQATKTGQNAFEQRYQKTFFEYVAGDPESGAIFDRGMAGFSAQENSAIASAYDFNPFSQVVDMGGGQGGLIVEILKRYPKPRGMLYDLERVTRAPTLVQAAGLSERCDIVTGDFFQTAPSGADAYVFKRILHDWSDEACVSILKVTRAAMPAHGRVLVVDAALRPGNAPDLVKLTDLLLMGVTTGRERTEAEFQEVFTAAGLKLTRVVPTASLLSILEATPA
jgi:hypothetical protein